MTKISRVTQQIFGQNATTNQITAFGTAKTSNPTYTRDLSQIMNANFLSGWASAILADKAPYEEDTNALFYVITTQLAYLFQQGLAEWSATTEYHLNSLCTVIENGNLVIKRSLTNNNVGNNPITSTTNWVDYFSQRVIHTIGDPIFTLSPVLNENEIWLEGATVSRTTYANLFAIYGTTYGVGNGSTTFGLPDFRNRAVWGSETFGYISAGLPNITGGIDMLVTYKDSTAYQGVFDTSWSNTFRKSGVDQTLWNSNMVFNASLSNSIYGNSSTVQPPAIKVRVKTRYQ